MPGAQSAAWTAGPSVMALLLWWRQQMTDLLAQRLASRRRYATVLVARHGATGLALSARRGGVETPLEAAIPAGHTPPAILALSPAALLEQVAVLPLAAERDVGAVLRYEMDRLTPFRADDLFWTWRVDLTDRANKSLVVRLLLVPKLGVQAALAAMEAAGLRPVALEVPTGNGVEHLSLSGVAAAQADHRAIAAGCWMVASLALGIGLVPVLRQELAIARVESAVAALRPQVAAVDDLRRRIAAHTGSAALFAAEDAKFGNPLRALAAITSALADDTYLTAFALRDGKLSIAGRSAGAARLIGAMSNDPALRDPAFDAPVTRSDDRTDVFSIQAGLAP